MPMTKKEAYSKCMALGKATGCHQRPDRSFFFRGHQFPVCARCTGVFIGEAFAILLFRFFEISVVTAIVFCLIMLMDWLIQHLGYRESNNVRRLITGLLCGYGFGNFIMKSIQWGCQYFV